ncbi:MAG: asparaginase [Actinobacteria bacterium]|nr:asparaginase [Actinomycetota bacterium]
MSVPVAHVVRSGFVEGAHFGSAVVVDAQGKVEWSIGDVTSAMFPRSSNKLMQGLAMVRSGLPLRDELLALACASHSGEDFHISGVQDILNAANLDTSALQCPADWPLDEIERDTLLAAGQGKSSLYMNCSGKHSAMLFTSVLNGWDTDTYLKPNHAIQEACRETIESVTGEKVEHIGVDGCGAPLMSMSLTGLARSFSQFAGPAADADQKKIATAIKENPQYLGGTRRDVTQLMQGVPGLVAKDGAEAVYGIGLGDGRAVALKIEDGADRARIVVAMSILQKVMGVVSQEVERQLDSQELFGGGVHVGKVIPAFSV